jgi:hypothetical protein
LRKINFDSFLEFSPAYRTPLRFAVAQHFIVILLTAFLLDGGAMLRASSFAVAAHWVVIVVVMCRRRSAPTGFDLGLIRVGFLPVAIIAGAIAGLLGRTAL